jgi:hypothetical protein
MNAWKAYLTDITRSEFVDAMKDDEVCTWTDKDWTCRLHMKKWNDDLGDWELYATGYKKGRMYKAWIYPDGLIEVF